MKIKKLTEKDIQGLIDSLQGYNPKGDGVIVMPDDAEEKIGMIIVPDTAKEKPQRGTVVAVGPGRITGIVDGKVERMPTDLKVGEHVLYGKYTGTEWEFQGKKFMCMRAADILGNW